MSIYDINFPDLANKLNAPILRKSRFTAYLNVLVGQFTWNHNRFFTDYADGSNYAAYNNLTFYSFGDIVLYTDSLNITRVYLCINSEASFGIAGIPPTDTDNWLLLFDNFVGANERMAWTNQRLCLEYILNKYCGSNFYQPPATSDIYITNTGSGNQFPLWTEPATWNSGTTYAINAKVTYNGRIWISLQSSNTNHVPDSSSTYWDFEPDVFTRYISIVAYSARTIVRYGHFHFISLQATTGNAPPTAGGINTWWRQVDNIWYYEPTRAYTIGEVVDYNSNVYMCILGTTGHAPPNATYWASVGGPRSTAFPGVDNCGFNVNIPESLYVSLGGNHTAHPNKADETIFMIVRKFWSAYQFRIITY